MKRHLLWLGLVIASLTTVRAQTLRLGYYGETVTHYGLRAAYERPFASYTKERNAALKSFYLSLGIALYRHPQNHVGLIVSPEIGYRRTGRRGGLFELAVSPAFFRYFLDGQTYEPTESGDFRRVRLAGGQAFMPTVSVGIGRDLSVRHRLPLSLYTRLNLMQQRPYNTSALMRFGIEFGTLIPLKKS
ncbi:hypothetical protein [Tellurirhabdus rosea]|uniref:hypothetical protein n=1 Tax=Tellurirhabdus rosea TaxID=2674997 RepID=UPI00225A6860|nr:hypothetical protein [Tellurirhabdus rosea]